MLHSEKGMTVPVTALAAHKFFHGRIGIITERIGPALMHRVWSVRDKDEQSRCHAFLFTSGQIQLSPHNEPELILEGPALIWLPRHAEVKLNLAAGGEGIVLSAPEDLIWRAISGNVVTSQLRMMFDQIMIVTRERITPQLNDLRFACEALEREIREQPLGAAIMANTYLSLILLQLWRATGPEAKSSRGVRPDTLIVSRFRQLVELHYRDNLRIVEYAAQLNVTRAQLHEACLRATHRTPLAVVHARLIEEARSRLEQTELPVEQIGYSLGFQDPGYFNRFFKRHTGQSPGAFRRLCAGAKPKIEADPAFAAWP
jgi:AraC family transcriptional regulator, transcriptional activator of pobA